MSVRASIHDVAQAAGVSRQTVTRAMNDMPGIASATRERVLRAASELRYRPSRTGRDLVKGGGRTIGLVVHSLLNPYFPELASEVVGAAAQRGWSVLLADARFASGTHDLLRDLGSQVDVVVGYLGHISAQPAPASLPMVGIDSPENAAYPAVHYDLSDAMTQLAEHFARTGVRHPVFVTPYRDSATVRGDAFAAAMASHDVAVRIVHGDGERIEAGVAAAHEVAQLRQDGVPVDAVLAFNDVIACGILKGLRQAGLVVPDDIRVAGMDGLGLGTVVSPELTTLAVDLQEVAAHAVDLALEAFEHGGDARREVAYRLIVRESG